MTLGSLVRLFSFPVAVAITALGFAGVAAAADQPGAAATAAPAAVGDYRGCATCNGAAAACDSCGKVRKLNFHRTKTCTPYQTHLCPGACFGYFQTQWHRWENVCPIPYQGVGLTDAPVRAAPIVAPIVIPKTTSSDGPIPKPVPVVPPVPGK